MAKSNEVAIRVDNVSKTFKLPHEKNSSLKSAALNRVKQKKGYEVQEALKDVSFEVKEGEFFGIVGRNGSGKSTLLKCMAGVYTPNKGSIHINGTLVPFIELGVGFNPELSGRDNVFLNGALLGFNRKQIGAMYNEIVEFAELEAFMDQKLKNYSSGMQVRLAFSIAIQAKGDILLLDEVLAVGDSAFQQKCFSYFEEIKKQKKTVVLVTHDMNSVMRFCDRALLIEDGTVKIIGSSEKVSTRYIVDNMNTKKDKVKKEESSNQIKSLEVTMRSPSELTYEDKLVFDVEYELSEDLPIYLAFSIMFNGLSMVEHNSKLIKINHTRDKKHKVTYEMPLQQFNSQAFSVNVSIFKEDNAELVAYVVNACDFFVQGRHENGTKGGPINTDGVWIQR